VIAMSRNPEDGNADSVGKNHPRHSIVVLL
jgi:hypothetical protein